VQLDVRLHEKANPPVFIDYRSKPAGPGAKLKWSRSPGAKKFDFIDFLPKSTPFHVDRRSACRSHGRQTRHSEDDRSLITARPGTILDHGNLLDHDERMLAQRAKSLRRIGRCRWTDRTPAPPSRRFRNRYPSRLVLPSEMHRIPIPKSISPIATSTLGTSIPISIPGPMKRPRSPSTPTQAHRVSQIPGGFDGHQRYATSNYGKRVDCYALGEFNFAAGYGHITGPDGLHDELYEQLFGDQCRHSHRYRCGRTRAGLA
jgi:hypothetical protein